jgi:HTH-type transcriptional regulator/antitoxin HipB
MYWSLKERAVDYPIKTIAQLQPILQGFRKATGLSQTAVAKKLGITQQSYAQFELNPQLASAERLIKILRLFNVEISLSQSADPQLKDEANSEITNPIKQGKKSNKQRPELIPSKTSRTTLEMAKKESW